jgi:hypothetical protein
MTSEISASGSVQMFFSFSLSSIIVKREFPQQLSQISFVLLFFTLFTVITVFHFQSKFNSNNLIT